MRLKRLISAFIACAMLVTFMPMQAFAAPDDELYEVSQSQQDNSTVLNDWSESDVEDDISTQQVNYQLEKTVGWSEKIECGKWSNLAWETDDYWTNSDYRVVQVTDYHPIIGTVRFNAISPGTTTITLYEDKEHTKVRYQWEITVEEDNNKSTDESRESFEFSANSSNVDVAYAYYVDGDVASDLYPLKLGGTICLPGTAKEYPIAFYVRATKGYVPESRFECAGSDGEYYPIDETSDLPQSKRAREDGYTKAFSFTGNKWFGYDHREFTIKAVPVEVSVQYASDTSDTVSDMPDEDVATYTHKRVDDKSEYQHEIVLPSQEPSREGYTFKGWKLESDGITLNAKGLYQHDDEITLDDNTWISATEEQATITFVAQWEEDEESVESTAAYFYVLNPDFAGDPTTTDTDNFYYVGKGKIKENTSDKVDFDNGVTGQITDYPDDEKLEEIGAGAIANQIGENFSKVFWYRTKYETSGANGNNGTIIAEAPAWHVDGILRPVDGQYTVLFLWQNDEDLNVVHSATVDVNKAIGADIVSTADEAALKAAGKTSDEWHVVWSKDGKQVDVAEETGTNGEILVFYADFDRQYNVNDVLANFVKKIEATGTLEGAYDFNFKLTDNSGNVVCDSIRNQTPITAGEESQLKCTKDQLIYLNAGQNYTLEEVGSGMSNWTYADPVTFTLNEDGTITIGEQTYSSSNPYGVINRYGQPTQWPTVREIAAQLTKQVTITAENPTAAELFTFNLTDENNTLIDTLTTSFAMTDPSWTQNGKVYTKTGMIVKDQPQKQLQAGTYSITEVEGTASGWEYDSDKITFTVANDGKCTFTSDTTFANTYKTYGDITAKKSVVSQSEFENLTVTPKNQVIWNVLTHQAMWPTESSNGWTMKVEDQNLGQSYVIYDVAVTGLANTEFSVSDAGAELAAYSGAQPVAGTGLFTMGSTGEAHFYYAKLITAEGTMENQATVTDPDQSEPPETPKSPDVEILMPKTVTYVVEGIAPATHTLIPEVKTYYAGQPVEVADPLTTTETTYNGINGTWTFNGWSGVTIENGSFIMPNNAVTLTGSWTFTADNQIIVNYRSNDERYGTVSEKQQVFTFEDEDIKSGNLPEKRLSAEATETSDGDFDRWTSSDFGTLFPVYRATLDVDVTFTVDQLGKTLEVVANFDRETGGGGAQHPDAGDGDDDDNDRDDDTEEIIDEEVPLAETPWLNTEDHYAYIIGYSEDGTVRPNANITRAEVATIFFRLLTDEARDQFWMTSNNFSDVLPNDWYNNAVSTMVNMGIIQGYEDGTFRPNANITRAEFAAIAARFMASGYGVEDDLFTDIANHWARESINDAAMAGWINGYEDGTFRPDAAITRAEAVTLVNNVLQRKPDADHMLDSMIKWPDNPEGTWYYEAIQEATNSHDYDLFEDAEYETWTALQENRDWAALEKDWVNTHRTGGEVA